MAPAQMAGAVPQLRDAPVHGRQGLVQVSRSPVQISLRVRPSQPCAGASRLFAVQGPLFTVQGPLCAQHARLSARANRIFMSAGCGVRCRLSDFGVVHFAHP
jgi:hypothetical protein